MKMNKRLKSLILNKLKEKVSFDVVDDEGYTLIKCENRYDYLFFYIKDSSKKNLLLYKDNFDCLIKDISQLWGLCEYNNQWVTKEQLRNLKLNELRNKKTNNKIWKK